VEVFRDDNKNRQLQLLPVYFLESLNLELQLTDKKTEADELFNVKKGECVLLD
jgi:hypothetical protein